MAINKKMEDAINKQINAEMYSAYLYMSMAADFESKNLKGFANWMTIQAQEEMSHTQKLYNYINERGGRVVLEAIEKPQTEWSTALDVFQDAYKHEQKVTGMINNLMNIALEVNDHASASFLRWFIDEQVEEEAHADEVVQKLTLAKDAPGALFMMDQELGNRVFVNEATGGE